MTLNAIKIFLSSALTFIAYLLGGFDVAIQVLLVMVILDYITGIMSAIVNKNIDYHKGLVGILKKVGIFIVIMVSVQVEKLLGQAETIHPIIAYFYAANEGFSVLKNLKEIGLSVPDIFYNKLGQMVDNSMAQNQSNNPSNNKGTKGDG